MYVYLHTGLVCPPNYTQEVRGTRYSHLSSVFAYRPHFLVLILGYRRQWLLCVSLRCGRKMFVGYLMLRLRYRNGYGVQFRVLAGLFVYGLAVSLPPFSVEDL